MQSSFIPSLKFKTYMSNKSRACVGSVGGGGTMDRWSNGYMNSEVHSKFELHRTCFMLEPNYR